MALANPVKGQLEVVTAAGAYTFCYPWGVQVAITKRLGGKQFLAAIGQAIQDLGDEELAYLFGMGLKSAHPTLSEDDVAGILSEIGPGAALRMINDSVAAAYDLVTPEGAPDPSRAAEPTAPGGTSTPVSDSGSASASATPTTSGT